MKKSLINSESKNKKLPMNSLKKRKTFVTKKEKKIKY